MLSIAPTSAVMTHKLIIRELDLAIGQSTVLRLVEHAHKGICLWQGFNFTAP